MISNFNMKQFSRGRKLRLVVLTLLATVGLANTARADVVTDWNQIAINTANTISPRLAQQTRALAMTQVAIFDAINSIDHRFTSYAIRVHAPSGASPEAASAAAAHRVLLSLAPTQQANLDAAYAASLAQIADGAAKTDGITVGEAVAGAILGLRSGDGSTITLPYTQPPAPGIWQPTPPAFLSAVEVAWGNVLPFTMRSGSQFLPGPPPTLTSEDYTEDFKEVRRLGSINSTDRTADQTEAAKVLD